jgi:hypothetical protein
VNNERDLIDLKGVEAGDSISRKQSFEAVSMAMTGSVWKLSQALDDASEGFKLFREVQLELAAFHGVIVQLQNLVANGAVLSEEQADRSRKVLAQMESLITDFYQHNERFKGGPADKDRTKRIVNMRKKVLWSFLGKRKVQHFRESMQTDSAILGLIMQALNRFGRIS